MKLAEPKLGKDANASEFIDKLIDKRFHLRWIIIIIFVITLSFSLELLINIVEKHEICSDPVLFRKYSWFIT